jgi:hypothetical protein
VFQPSDDRVLAAGRLTTGRGTEVSFLERVIFPIAGVWSIVLEHWNHKPESCCTVHYNAHLAKKTFTLCFPKLRFYSLSASYRIPLLMIITDLSLKWGLICHYWAYIFFIRQELIPVLSHSFGRWSFHFLNQDPVQRAVLSPFL